MNVKKLRKLIALLLCSIFILSALPVSAMTEASKQISQYNMDAYWDNNKIVVDFHIVGTGIMDELGAESIKIYRKVGTHWVFEAEADRYVSGMTGTNRQYHAGAMSYPGDSNLEYKVVVTVFAENSEGYDSRSKTFYI